MAERNNAPPRMTALGLLEQMRRSNAANREAPFDPIAAFARERRAGPTAPLFGGQRQPPLPIPPRPPAVIPPPQPQRAAPQAAAAPQARTPAQALPVPPRPPQLGADGNPIPPAVLPQVPGAEPQPLHVRFNPENPYVATATQMAERYGLPPNVLLSLLHQESRFDPNAVSRAGALGIGQLMPGTARDLGVDPRDPMQNIEGSARYLRQQLDRFGGDMNLALAAYNAGPRRVAEAGNAIPDIAETRAYVPSVMRNAGMPGYAKGGLAELEHKYAKGGLNISDAEYDRRLLERMSQDARRTFRGMRQFEYLDGPAVGQMTRNNPIPIVVESNDGPGVGLMTRSGPVTVTVETRDGPGAGQMTRNNPLPIVVESHDGPGSGQMMRSRPAPRPAPREELTADQLNAMVLDRLFARYDVAPESAVAAEARDRIGRAMGYAEGGRVGRAVGLIRRAVTPEPEAARIPSEPTRSVFPAPQRFFDPEDRAYKSSLQDFEYEPGGRYLEMRRGETPRDITGESVDNARISVGPNGRPSMMVGEPTDLPTGSPGRGSTATKTNLFKRSAGWKWTDAPEGYADIPTLVSVENRNQHYYALSADYPRGVDLSRYPDSKQEPRLRPTTQGNVYPGNQVGTISVRGREHPVYDNITVRQAAPAGMVGAAAASGEDDAPASLEHLERKYSEGGRVMSDEEYDRRLLERMKRDTGRTTESTNAEQARALRSAGYDAAQLASDIFLPQSPLDAALMVALGPGGRMARLAGSTALMAMEPSEAEAGGLRRLIRAYHGSPHEFAAERLIRRPGGETEFMVGATDRLPDVPEGVEVLRDYPLGRLRMDKIGTGAGAQAYTHGLYFGEAEDTARHIRDKLSQPSSGRIYEVDIDASPDRLMDWYLPRSQQPGPVQDALRSLGSRIPEETPIYGAMNRSRRNSLFAGDVIGADTATPAEVSDRLREAGIQGLTYLEPGSRTAEIAPRSRNYVIYDPEIIDITRRYAHGGLAQLEHKYAEGGIVSGGATPYDPDAVNALANQIEAGYV